MPMAGAAHLQRLDGRPHLFHAAAVDFDQLDRQPRLVDHPQAPVNVAEPMQGGNIFHKCDIEKKWSEANGSRV